jgi:hypothetical protein
MAWWQPLVGVSLGWLLAQLTEWWRQERRSHRYRDAIRAELRDIHSSVNTRIDDIKGFMKKGQIQRGVDLPVNISHQIFKTRFSEILLDFTERERLLLVHVYDTVDGLNANFSTIRQHSDVYLGREDSINDNLRKILIATRAAYINACKIHVLIDMFDKKGDIRDARSIERLNRVASEAATEVRSLRGEP